MRSNKLGKPPLVLPMTVYVTRHVTVTSGFGVGAVQDFLIPQRGQLQLLIGDVHRGQRRRRDRAMYVQISPHHPSIKKRIKKTKLCSDDEFCLA